MKNSFEETYPNIASWVESQGWIEIGYQNDYNDSFIRALDEGGMVWEGKKRYKTLDEAMQDLEKGLAKWVEENE